MSSKLTDVLRLRRSAGETKKYAVLMRVLGLLAVVLILLVMIAYAISYFYDKYGSFTVKVNKYDMVNQGLSLSETPDYDNAVFLLNAGVVYDMTNISGLDLPDNLDMINGSHNGKNYFAYTFYVINCGDDTLSYKGELTVESSTKGADEAIRVMVYKNGEKTVYGKTKKDGTGKERDCDKEFLSSNIITREIVEGFSPKEKNKYTVVIWLEGNDPECINNILGGIVKLRYDFTIVETT